MFKEGPIRSLLKGQASLRSNQLDNLERMSVGALPGELEANNLYVSLFKMARSLGLEEIAFKFDQIAIDEADHYRIIRDEIIPAIKARRGST